MSFPKQQLPLEATVEAYYEWMRHDAHTWYNDRSPMTLNAKSETMSRVRRAEPRRLSARAAVRLLREERDKGLLDPKSETFRGPDPFLLLVWVGYLESTHKPEDLCEADLVWLRGMLVELLEQLQGVESWSYGYYRPETLRHDVLRCLVRFELLDEAEWIQIARLHQSGGKDPGVEVIIPFDTLSRAANPEHLSDENMGELLAPICIWVIKNYILGEDFRFAKLWFSGRLTSRRVRPHAKRWFREARKRLSEPDLPQFDRLMRVLRMGVNT